MTGQIAGALHRTAIGDHTLAAALGSVVHCGLDLPVMVSAGLITLEPGVEDVGGGWWVEIEWLDVLDALDTGCLPATASQIFVVRASAAACGHLITLSPTHARSDAVHVAHDEGPRAGHVDAIPAQPIGTHLVYDGPRWMGVYRRTSPLRLVETRWGPAEIWTVVR